MKTINVSDEMYDFLIELSRELNTQNHRATQMPYFFQIQTKEEVPAAVGCGIQAWYCDGSKIETDEEIMETIFEYKGWDLESKEDIDKYNQCFLYEIEVMLENIGFRKVYYELSEKYENAFLTEKACREHIVANKHHYCEPIDYLSYAFRNPELEKVMQFLCELTNGKLHK
jgi:hypothetical protein